MYATSRKSGDIIYEKTLPLALPTIAVDFAPGLGTVFIDDGGTDLNNATSTKQNLDASTGLLVLATNKADTQTYWQRYLPLAPDGTPPVLQTAVANGATLTLTYNEALNTASVPAAGAFSVNGGHSVTAVNVTGSTVALTLVPGGHRRRDGSDRQLHARREPDRGRRGQRRSRARQPDGDELDGRRRRRLAHAPAERRRVPDERREDRNDHLLRRDRRHDRRADDGTTLHPEQWPARQQLPRPANRHARRASRRWAH